MAKKMGNPLTEGAAPVHAITPLKSTAGPVHKGGALPGGPIHKHTPAAGAVPPRRGSGNQVSGIDTALSQHADVLHPTGNAYKTGYVGTPKAGAKPPRMSDGDADDKIKSGGY